MPEDIRELVESQAPVVAAKEPTTKRREGDPALGNDPVHGAG
jgi:hypothetical protein